MVERVSRYEVSDEFEFVFENGIFVPRFCFIVSFFEGACRDGIDAWVFGKETEERSLLFFAVFARFFGAIYVSSGHNYPLHEG